MSTSSEPSKNSARCLRPYQELAVTRFYENDATIALMPIGSGKTASALHAIKELLDDGAVTRVLIVAPLRVAEHVWLQEAALYPALDGLEIRLATGTEKQRRGALAGRVIVINFENLGWLTKQPEFDYFDGLVWDELSKMRGVSSHRTKAIRRRLRQFKWILGLTGELVSTGLENLFTQAAVVDRGKALGRTITDFRRIYLENTTPWADYPTYEERAGARGKVFERLEPLIFQIPDSVYADQLPELNVVPVVTDLDDTSLYDELVAEGLVDLAGFTIENHASQKLEQAAQGFLYDADGEAHWFDTNKVDALGELLTDEPTLVVYNYTAMRDRLMATWGGVPLDVDGWNAGRVPLMYIHPDSAGHGLNLQDGGHRLIWIAPPWTPDIWKQVNGRLRRGDQKHPVTAHVMVSAGTIEERIVEVLQGRQDLGAAIRKYFAA